MDEGYIKFQVDWKQISRVKSNDITDLNYWRNEMYQQKWIGAYDNGIGFGNISERWKTTNNFIISGSATGNFSSLTADHYALVTKVDIEKNSLYCEGATIASSESMSHAVIFQALPWVNAVIHIHDLENWEKLLYNLPTTPKEIPYGTCEMAYSIQDLIKNTSVAEQKIFVMAGHIEGIFAFGKDLKEASAVIFAYLEKNISKEKLNETL